MNFELDSKEFSAWLKHDVLLKDYSTFKIGGKAKLVFHPPSKYDLQKFLKKISEKKIPFAVVGKGSNLLFPDSGFNGVVIVTTPNLGEIGIFENRDEETIVYAGAGATNEEIFNFFVKNRLAGFEFLYDIPGTIGGAVVMNASNNDGETSQIVHSVEFIDVFDGFKLKTLPRSEIYFGYRKTSFSKGSGKIITGVYLFGKKTKKIHECVNKAHEIKKIRESKFPLSYPNCGSVFLRPPGNFAGYLIEKANLKGAKVGGAMVSHKHAGFIVNTGSATARDVKLLIEKIQRAVYEKFGVKLERELIFLEECVMEGV